jgi:hypothetical protein
MEAQEPPLNFLAASNWIFAERIAAGWQYEFQENAREGRETRMRRIGKKWVEKGEFEKLPAPCNYVPAEGTELV